MNKIIKPFFLVVAVLLFTVPVFAQDPPPNVGAQRWFCLKATRSGTHDAIITLDPVKSPPAPGINTYIFVKINNTLSTGNPTLDADSKIFGSTQNYDALRSTVGFDNKGVAQIKPTGGYTTREGVGIKSPGTNPVADPSNLNATWYDFVTADGKGGNSGLDHYWFGMQIINTGDGGGNGGDSGLKNGTFSWAVNANASDCTSIKWDPLGYVFDAQTLGVIPGASITIFDATKTPPRQVPQGVGAGQVATNPYTTPNNGMFSFFTDPGSYLFTMSGSYNSIPLSIADPTMVNPNYKTKGYTNIYKAGVPVVEAIGQTVRTDIAVNTVGATPPPSLPPSLSDINMNASGEQMQISGKVLNYTPEVPNAKVVVVYRDSVTQQSQESALVVVLDANGWFEFQAPQVLDGKSTYIISGLELRNIGGSTTQIKNYLDRFIATLVGIKDSFFVVHAAQISSVAIDPIPSYLEGITFPYALVGTYLQGSDVATYQTKADINGHYIIGSQFIPPLPYEIRIQKVTGEVIKMSTTEYIKQNAQFHKANNINTFSTIKTTTSVDDTNTLVVTKTLVPQNTNQTGSNSTTKTGNTMQSSGRAGDQTQVSKLGITGTGMQGVIMIVVVIIMLIMIGVGAFIVMKSKQQQIPPQI